VTHDCKHRGHIWLEADGTLFARTRDLSQREPIAVLCRHCPATATLAGYALRPLETVEPSAIHNRVVLT
jgi:hypothetical protein